MRVFNECTLAIQVFSAGRKSAKFGIQEEQLFLLDTCFYKITVILILYVYLCSSHIVTYEWTHIQCILTIVQADKCLCIMQFATEQEQLGHYILFQNFLENKLEWSSSYAVEKAAILLAHWVLREKERGHDARDIQPVRIEGQKIRKGVCRYMVEWTASTPLSDVDLPWQFTTLEKANVSTYNMYISYMDIKQYNIVVMYSVLVQAHLKVFKYKYECFQLKSKHQHLVLRCCS